MKETVFVFFFYMTEFQFVTHPPKKKTIYKFIFHMNDK